MSKRTALVWGVIALCGVAGCGRGGPPAGGPGGPVHVVGVHASERPVEDRVEVVGTLAADESVDVKSELDGVVEEVGFAEGQPVEAGAVLFQIDRRKLEASLAEAEANRKLAEVTLARYTALAQSDAVSKQEVDQAQTAFEVRRAAAQLISAQLADATVVAPFAGMAGARLVSVGQYVTRGQPLTSVIDADPMKAAFDVPERFLGRLAEGQAVDLRVAAYPEDVFKGTVYFIAPQVNPETRTILVKAQVPNTDGRLRPGMFANLALITQVRERAVVVPEAALMLRGQASSVFIATEQGAVEEREVATGARLAGWVEIASGLRAGETVITEGLQKVHPGSQVTVRYEEPSAR